MSTKDEPTVLAELARLRAVDDRARRAESLPMPESSRDGAAGVIAACAATAHWIRSGVGLPACCADIADPADPADRPQ